MQEAPDRYPRCVGLLTGQKNALLNTIKASDVPPTEFRLGKGFGGAAEIDHLPTSSTFTVDSVDGANFFGIARVGDFGGFEYGAVPWHLMMEVNFRGWLQDVKLEAETPDLWEDLRRGSELISESARPDLANTPFTPAEQEQISAQLKEIRTQVAELCSLTEEQSARIEERFDQGEEASRRLGRKDWILLFGGAMLSLVVSAVVPPEVLQHALTMTAQRLGHLFGGGPPQLPPQAS